MNGYNYNLDNINSTLHCILALSIHNYCNPHLTVLLDITVSLLDLLPVCHGAHGVLQPAALLPPQPGPITPHLHQ